MQAGARGDVVVVGIGTGSSFIHGLLTGKLSTQAAMEAAIGVVSSAITILLIVVGSIAVLKVSWRVIDRMFMSRESHERKLYRDTRRLGTLRTVIKSIIKYVVYFVGSIMVLSELGVNTSGLLAGAGIAGVALGFGAQNLVKDIITGFFILFDDQYAVGDYVTISDVSGIVEEIGLRVTRIRDFGGQLHIIPNGTIGLVTNFRGRSMRVTFDVYVSYSSDIEQAIALLNGAFEQHKGELGEVVDTPKVLGIQNLTDSGVQLRIWATAKPMQQWAVERQLKSLIKKVFDENGIEIGFPSTRVLLDSPEHDGDAGSDAAARRR